MTRILIAALLLGGISLGSGDAVATPKHCPPGHAKKGWCTPGGPYALPPGIRYRKIRDWDRYGLPRPRRGAIYVELDREVFLILEATREVLEAIGAVDRVLR